VRLPAPRAPARSRSAQNQAPARSTSAAGLDRLPRICAGQDTHRDAEFLQVLLALGERQRLEDPEQRLDRRPLAKATETEDASTQRRGSELRARSLREHGDRARIAVAGEREEQAARLEIVGDRTPVARRDMREQDFERFRRARSTESLERGEAQAPVRRSESCRERRQFGTPRLRAVLAHRRDALAHATPRKSRRKCTLPEILNGRRQGHGPDRKHEERLHRFVIPNPGGPRNELGRPRAAPSNFPWRARAPDP
jgi:hypothetical protein